MDLNKALRKFLSVSFTILVILIVVVGLIKLGSTCYNFGYRVFTEPAVSAEPGEDVVVSITSDMSDREVGKLLEEKGLVRDANLFYAQLKLSAYSGKLIPGIYTLNTSMTGKEMIVVLATETEDTESEGSSTYDDSTEEYTGDFSDEYQSVDESTEAAD